jgi:hypothetical protein
MTPSMTVDADLGRRCEPRVSWGSRLHREGMGRLAGLPASLAGG